MTDARPATGSQGDPGGFLKRAREARRVPLEDVAQTTKIKVEFLRSLEEGALDRLPAKVFVRGFARAYAQAVGACPEEASRRIAHAYAARERTLAGPEVVELVAPYEGDPGREAETRRRFGVVLVVLVILLAATLTLSLLLKRPGPTAGGLSQRAPAPAQLEGQAGA